jgi:hypothetical protein
MLDQSKNAHSDEKPSKVANTKILPTRSTILPLIAIGILVICAAIGVWQLQPKQLPQGRPIGDVGKIQALALPVKPTGEHYAIWRDGRQTFALNTKSSVAYERIELSSNDVDVGGNNGPDLVLYTWTGGAHCCFSQILIDGHSGKRLGEVQLGNGDPTPFIPTKTKGLARAVAINFDDVSAFKFGSYTDSPMARILIVWEGNRFALDTKRMKAIFPSSPPSFFINEPELGEAASIGMQEFGEDEDNPAPAIPSVTARGDRAKAYESWMNREEERMGGTKLNPDDLATYGPMAAFLNERIYKGHGVAGVQTVLETYATEPEVTKEALSYYFNVLDESRWKDDLNKLNDGSLKGLIATYTTSKPVQPNTQVKESSVSPQR